MAENTKYLYGAAVQGIQQFIFQTNELKDIVGASELVEQICTTAFDKFGKPECGESIIRAAGNIKFIFNKREDCENAVLYFPKTVMTMAPGITISQAVVEFSGSESFEDLVNKLEKKLRTQRNKPMQSLTLGLMGIDRSRRTGLPTTHINGEEHLDEATHRKRSAVTKEGENVTKSLCNKSFGIENVPFKKIPLDISTMTGDNDWVAIIHADGNSLGETIMQIGSDKDLLSKFSKSLGEATVKSAVAAFNTIMGLNKGKEDDPYPLRPVVLGGDDVTLICRGDLAIPYVAKFLEEFENNTRDCCGQYLTDAHAYGPGGRDHLTACAGIAFIKSSYPFYYGYNLAEELCEQAKKDAKKEKNRVKGLPPSCLMLYKVQDSFTESYDKIVARELQLFNTDSFEFGPYYIKKDETPAGRWTIDDLTNNCKLISNDKDGNALKSHLRKWMSLKHNSNDDAVYQYRQRMLDIISNGTLHNIANDVTEGIQRDNETFKRYPVYDMLALNTINNQKVDKENKNGNN